MLPCTTLVKITLCLCLCALAQPPGGDSEQAKAARSAIGQVLSNQVEAWNKGDLQGFMAGYHRSKNLTFYSGGTVFKGWDAMLDRYKKKYQGEGKEMGKLAFSDIDIELLGSDNAVVRGRWALKMSNDQPAGLFTLIFRKTADGWRIVHDHTSN